MPGLDGMGMGLSMDGMPGMGGVSSLGGMPDMGLGGLNSFGFPSLNLGM